MALECARESRQGFQVSATDVSETLETLVLRDTDFVKTLRSVLTLQPHMSATRFEQWFSELSREHRLGGLGATVVESVPASELSPRSRRAAPLTRRFAGSSAAGSRSSLVAAAPATACCRPAARRRRTAPPSARCSRATGAIRAPRSAPTRPVAAPPRTWSARSPKAGSSWCIPSPRRT